MQCSSLYSLSSKDSKDFPCIDVIVVAILLFLLL
jgi:hypothetical protein